MGHDKSTRHAEGLASHVATASTQQVTNMSEGSTYSKFRTRPTSVRRHRLLVSAVGFPPSGGLDMLERRSPKSASPGLGLRYEWIVRASGRRRLSSQVVRESRANPVFSVSLSISCYGYTLTKALGDLFQEIWICPCNCWQLGRQRGHGGLFRNKDMGRQKAKRQMHKSKQIREDSRFGAR